MLGVDMFGKSDLYLIWCFKSGCLHVFSLVRPHIVQDIDVIVSLYVSLIGYTSCAMMWVVFTYLIVKRTRMWVVYIHVIRLSVHADLIVGLVCGHLCIGVTILR